ncbi:MAG TPA: hypothetical protein DDY18_04615 [Flavobacterium sp.]|jgi:hypothetical protein|nr:hypothetical protein [Flavobacterium sp.]
MLIDGDRVYLTIDIECGYQPHYSVHGIAQTTFNCCVGKIELYEYVIDGKERDDSKYMFHCEYHKNILNNNWIKKYRKAGEETWQTKEIK